MNEQKTPSQHSKEAQKKRLEAALRANLQRRKTQARGRDKEENTNNEKTPQ